MFEEGDCPLPPRHLHITDIFHTLLHTMNSVFSRYLRTLTLTTLMGVSTVAQAAYLVNWETSGNLNTYYNLGNVGIGVSDPDEKLEINGRLHIGRTIAPTTETDKLYNIDGTLYWAGTPVGAAPVGGGGGGVSDVFLTTAQTDGNFGAHANANGKTGYQAANEICMAEDAASHYCRTDEVIEYITTGDITGWLNTDTAWIAEGPPGYTANSNDCKGWTENTQTFLGAFWAFDSDGGGMGWLTNCSVEKSLTCCK